MEIAIITLFVALFIKHFIVDFISQTKKQVDEKGTYGAAGGIAHAADHGWWTTGVLSAFFLISGPVTGLSIILAIGLGFLDGVIHYHIDWLKMNLSKALTIYDKKFWVFLGLDQLMHYLTYALIVLLIVLL